MHLKQLKLAGFKSFVDPVTVPFSSQLVAVVGPNGCGKSNIIDAVRWVMGESSAKSLRGESMTDVIFNGSSDRKAVGQASVELVFDNRLGRLGGAYAGYQEIALKRLVTRDGESNYYLNGVRCRRRDITDIFLGTGAGARSYSIISQGTISRLIEARPEELRAYLEEAAGVSKYKERRRETMQRIASTHENLARVADVCDELGKQLVRLSRQAESAKKYTLLKDEERQCRADILALKWRRLTEERTDICTEINQFSVQYEYHQALVSSANHDVSRMRESIHDAATHLEKIKTEFYQLGMDIARLEEITQQQSRDKQRLTLEKEGLQTTWEKTSIQLREDNDALINAEQTLTEALAQVQHLQAQYHEQSQLYQGLIQKEASWNAAWQTVQSSLAQANREVEVLQLRIQHDQERRLQLELRLEKIQQIVSANQADELQAELSVLLSLKDASLQQQTADTNKVEQASKQTSVLRSLMLETEQHLHQVQDSLRVTSTEHAVLSVALNAAIHTQINDTASLSSWKNHPRIAEVIDVPPQWQQIVEWVLGTRMYAIVLDSIDLLMTELPNLKTCKAMFVEAQQHPALSGRYPRLVDYIQGTVPPGLEDVFAAETLTEAILWLPTLDSAQSVVTLDGFWLGQGWVRVSNQVQGNEESLLARKDALAHLDNLLTEQQAQVFALQTSRDGCHQRLTDHAKHQEILIQALRLSEEAYRDCDAKVLQKTHLLKRASEEMCVLLEEREIGLHELEDRAENAFEAKKKGQIASEQLSALTLQQEHLLLDKTRFQEDLVRYQRVSDETRQTLHTAEVQTERYALKTQQLRDNISREQLNLEVIKERLDTLAYQILALIEPDAQVNTSLDDKIQQHQQLEKQCVCAQQIIDEFNTQQRDSEQKMQRNTAETDRIQEAIKTAELKEQALKIRIDGVLESLSELEVTLDTQLAPGLTLLMREERLQVVLDSIRRLGAINLVAIEEYQTELMRKQHLDAQYSDLTEALKILDTAILKMDRETELRFKETFDEVNSLFQALFPRLFGGGRAMLELTCGNLLEAGVLVMAEPPGKRNSSIQLLSGGEKAMTAVALVFAIFKLNPSPFCMLDEVDAPLDDVNVRRFCDVMKEMSQCVQFMFITHNKVTMELADHLIGVTMREPGVSRVVAVDVEEALSIAE